MTLNNEHIRVTCPVSMRRSGSGMAPDVEPRAPAAEHDLRDDACVTIAQATGHRPQATGHRPQATGHRPQATGHEPAVVSPSGAWRRWFRLPASPPESLRGGARREAHLHRNPRAGGVAAATGSSVLARCRAFCLLAPLLAGLAGLPSGAVAQTPTLSVSPTSIDEGAVDTFTFTGFPSNWGPPTVQVSGVGYLSNCLLLRDSSFRLPGFDACGGLMDGTRSGRWDSEGREYRLALIAIADHVAEGQNTITVQFQDSIVTSRTATVSIALNDTTRQSFVSVDVVGSASVQEGQSFTVRFSMDPWFMLPSPTTVNYYLADYHGERVVLAPSISNPTRAYGENPRSVEIPAYHYFVDVEVPTMASADLDGDSKVEIILLGGKDYATSTGSVTLTVVDANPVTNEDDNTASQVQATPPTLTLGSDAASVTEGGEVTFTVTADAAPGIDIAVNLGAAEEMGEGLNYIGREQTGTVTLPADATSATWTVTAWSDEQQRADGTVAARIKPGDGYTIGTPSTVTVPLLDDDAPAVDPALVALVRSYAAETQNGADHVTRWRRVLVAFGVETYPGVTAMTAAEAEVLAATHNSSGRWTAVVATLTELEAGRAVQSNPQPIPQTGSTAVDPALVAEVRTLAGQTQHGADHVTRWRRVLVAFGVETYPGLTAMTAAEAEANARRYNSPLWPQIAAALAALETAATASSRQDDEPEPGPEPAPEPVVSITAGAGGAEGEALSFTLTADPAPAAALPVEVTVSAQGDYGVATGARTVTLPGTGSVTLTLDTTDDATDEADGSVTLTLNTGAGYSPGNPATATVAVLDDDEPAPEPVATPQGASSVDPALVALVRSYAAETQNGADHVTRWRRVLVAFGVETYPGVTAMTAAEAEVLAATHNSSGRWTAVVATLTELEAGRAVQSDPEPGPAPAPEPVVSITGGAGGAEGEALSFTLTADPAPAAALPVEVTVSAQGDYGVATGARTVTLPGTGSVTLTLDTTDDATDEADGSVTLTLNTGAGYSPGNPATATVAVLDDDEPAPEPEPVTLPTLSVGDEEAREGDAMEFEVTLSAPVSHEVRVRYVTWPGHDPITRAHYNLDFQPAEGELVFPPGATTRTFLVFTLDDSIDDPGDILEVELSNPVGATLADGHATGTITNSDPLPKAWLARMGRAVAQQTLDGITARFRAARTPGFEGALAGRAFTGNREPEDPDGAAPDTVSDEGWQADVGRRLDAGWDSGLRHGPGGADAFNGHTTLTLGEVLLGSSFAYTGKTDSQGGSFASWGRGSRAHFAGREDSLHLDGALTTALFGVDYARGDWLVGLALTQSWGAGHYRDPNADAGKLDTSLTAVLPYVAWRAGPRLELWGTAGHGGGSLTLAPDTDADTGHPAKTDTDWTMAAGGLRSELLAPGNGPSLALTADALWTRTAADRADGAETRSGLAGAEADVTRLRLGLAGSWTVDLGQGARLTPTLEAGARHDGGAADTGFGLELGGGIAWHAPRWGLSLDIKGRTLIAHEQAGFTERGLSASLAFDPSPLSAFGPRLTLTQALGSPADGGLEALLNPDPLRQQDGYADNRRWRLALDYGLPLFKGRLVGSPQLAIGRSQGARDLSLGWQLTPAGRHAPDMSLQLQALRRSSEYASAPEHALTLDLRANW